MCAVGTGGEVNTAVVMNIRPTGLDVDRSRVRMELGTVGGTSEGNTLEENEGV